MPACSDLTEYSCSFTMTEEKSGGLGYPVSFACA